MVNGPSLRGLEGGPDPRLYPPNYGLSPLQVGMIVRARRNFYPPPACGTHARYNTDVKRAYCLLSPREILIPREDDVVSNLS